MHVNLLVANPILAADTSTAVPSAHAEHAYSINS